MRVLILGARAPACLEWARAFRAAGWRVSVGDCLAWPLTRFSSAAHHYVRLPEPACGAAAWIQALRTAVIDHGIDLVLPTCEEAFYLAHGRACLPCKVLVPPFGLMHELHHKGRFAEKVRGWEVQTPETQLLETPGAIACFADSHDPREWVFKPAYSRFASHTLLCPHKAQILQLHACPMRPWVAQRYAAGREYCSYSLLADGRLTAHACYHPRYRAGRGSGIWFEPADPGPVRAFLARFGTETRYTGQVAFDFIGQPGGDFKVIECNPRATSGIHLFADQPVAAVHALLGAQGVLTPSAKPRQIALAMLLCAAYRQPLSAQFWRDYRVASDVIARGDDFGPLLGQIPGLLEIAMRALVRRRGLLAAATADIEWDGQVLETLP